MPRKLTTQEFVDRAQEIHGEKYDYSKVKYLHSRRHKVEIICYKHGPFWQTPDSHINSLRACGCPVCGRGGTLEERFWAKVDKEHGRKMPHMDTPCWEWTGSSHCKGYGQFRNGKMVKAHVFSYELHHGPIPLNSNKRGLYVLHHCDNPRCVRPDHLFLGTAYDNLLDAAQKGRRCLTPDNVREIRELWDSGEWTSVELGTTFGVSDVTIRKVVRREVWKTV